MKPAIVVVAYNRPQALERLLTSLAKLDCPPDVPLVISIDGNGDHGREVQQIANQFSWPFGPKRLIQHEQNLGLVRHVFACGDLTHEYGSIILLEDDLFVSPMLYHFAAQALDFYAGNERIAGIALNTLWFNGFTLQPFTPYLDEGDTFFLQVAWFQGQAYTQAQWSAFRRWRETAVTQVTPADPMHEIFTTFPDSDWFPIKTKYLVQSGRYYAFPRESLTTNFGDAGMHVAGTDFFQVPLQTRRQQFRLQTWDQALAVYDSFQEMLPDRLNRLTDRLARYDYTVDLNGTRSPAKIPTPYVLTSQSCRNPVLSFGLKMRPLEANVIYGIPGRGISLGQKNDLDLSWPGRWRSHGRYQAYFQRHPLGRLQQLGGGLKNAIPLKSRMRRINK